MNNKLAKNATDFFTNVLKTLSVRNADYAAPETTGNPYFNFDCVAAVHGDTPQEVIATEITKKAVRLANLVKPGVSPAGESRLDTLRDIAGYAAILYSLDTDEAEQLAQAQADSTQLNLPLEDETPVTSSGGRLSALWQKIQSAAARS